MFPCVLGTYEPFSFDCYDLATRKAGNRLEREAKMSAKIPAALSMLLEKWERSDPEREIAVVVTLSAGAGSTALEALGLKIEQRFESIAAVSGTIEVARIRSLAADPGVEKIELDGEMHAL